MTARTYNIALTLEHPEDIRSEDELETLLEATVGYRFLGEYRISVFEGWPVSPDQDFPPIWDGYETAVSHSAPKVKPADCMLIAVHESILPVGRGDDFIETTNVVYVGPNQNLALLSLQEKHGYIETWSNGKRIAVSIKN
jgi:hypothetical protein